MKRLLWLPTLVIALSLSAQCPRQTAVDDYNNVYLNTSFNVAEMAWTGDVATCTPGTIASSVHTKVIDRINYFRRMCDLDDNTILSTVLNSHSQESALMQEANGSLSHCTGANNAPCNTWSCNTANAILASQQGNLAASFGPGGGWNFLNPITNYMEDAGTGNEAVGHRRWILYSGGEEFGNGLTPNRQTLYVINNFGNPPNNNKDYIAYPPDGYIPGDLVFPRWSFGIPGGNFTGASVTMTDSNGGNVPLNIIYNASINFGDISIVWEPTGFIDTTNPEDVKYTVTVSGITGAAPQSSYTYDVIIIQPTHPPSCPSGLVWDETACDCVSPNGCDPVVQVNGVPILPGHYQAENTLHSTGTVLSGVTVEFEAGQYIELEPNFVAEAGSDFWAHIDLCQPGVLAREEQEYQLKSAQSDLLILSAKEEEFECVLAEAPLPQFTPIIPLQNKRKKRVKMKTTCPRF